MPAILKLPPELFPHVASHIPVLSLPATLFALALTAKDVHSSVHPVLYGTVIIQNEDCASQVLDRISGDEKLGSLVRELHLRLPIDLAAKVPKRLRKKITVLVKLQEAIEKGSLPHLKNLRVVLSSLSEHLYDANNELIIQYQLPRSFWQGLRRCCPLLRGICMDGITESLKEPWANEPDFYDLKDFSKLSSLGLKYDGDDLPSRECSDKLSRNIINLASSLQSLTLFLNGALQDAGPLLSLTFQRLKALRLFGFVVRDKEKAMSFWGRHHNLERVNVYTDHHRWFSDDVESALLPKVRYLRATYNDITALASRLGQLEHLCIIDSYNHQVPYLLRSALPGGLPKLKSLEIHQSPCSERFIRSTEGALWYETDDGQFRQLRGLKNADKYMDGAYLQSIARGAPNIEELCLHDLLPSTDTLEDICSALGQFKFLHRFYYLAFYRHKSTIDPSDMESFLQKCHLFGNSCASLRTVTDIGILRSGPYNTGNIIRGHGGVVEKVVPGRGFGMEFSGDDGDPFPLNKRRY